MSNTFKRGEDMNEKQFEKINRELFNPDDGLFPDVERFFRWNKVLELIADSDESTFDDAKDFVRKEMLDVAFEIYIEARKFKEKFDENAGIGIKWGANAGNYSMETTVNLVTAIHGFNEQTDRYALLLTVCDEIPFTLEDGCCDKCYSPVNLATYRTNMKKDFEEMMNAERWTRNRNDS